MNIKSTLKNGINQLKNIFLVRKNKKCDQAEWETYSEKNINEREKKNKSIWTDDYFAEVEISRTHYKNAFWITTGFLGVLLLCLCIVLPLQHTELVVLHEGVSGYTWFSTTNSKNVPKVTWAEEESEIARYVRARESYDPLLYAYQAKEVSAFSNPEVEAEYEMAQSSTEKNAPINVLGAKGYRTVVVNSILPISVGEQMSDVPGAAAQKNKEEKQKKSGQEMNLAEVSFVVKDHFFGQSETIDTPYTALISWKYTGVPDDPELLLMNWNGFQITKYSVDPVSAIDPH